MQAVKDLVQDFRELKAAAEAHNLHADADAEPGASIGAEPSGPQAEGKSSHGSVTTTSQSSSHGGDSSSSAPSGSGSGGGGRPSRLSLKPLAISSATAGPATIPEWHGIPPPPPRNLPHGWTARYDEKEKKYAYAHGVTAQEQWDFPADTGE